MPNEFQFSFPGKDIQQLISGGCERLVVTGKVVYDPKTKNSTFEIYAECGESESSSATRVIGCPMPC